MILIKLGTVFALLSVVIGAFGAHSFENIISNKMDVFKTAIQYQMFHSLALMITGLIAITTKLDLIAVGYLFFTGILLFSGSLYIIAIFKISKFGMIAPIGGLSFIMGWILLIYKIRSLH
tara:strand:- start:608 stop:967 length:360 start_codon:yes stop_codon:yes gene_type:complete